MGWWSPYTFPIVCMFLIVSVMGVVRNPAANVDINNNIINGHHHHNYKEALTKSILFFEGQRSGKLPSTQRMKWRKDSAVNDGQYAGVDLSGGYYDAGDNVKYNFPMSFTTSLLSWSVIEFGKFMGSDLRYAKEAIQWATDYLLKSTKTPGVVYAQIGDANIDHSCWERPEDMDTDRTAFAVNKTHPGSEVSAEIAAALAASSIVFRSSNMSYSHILLRRAKQVFEFADTYRGSYNDSLGKYVCPHYCDYGGYKDELLWAASWLYKASNERRYFDYVMRNKPNTTDIAFNWDDKGAGTNMLMSIESMRKGNGIWDEHAKKSFRIKADEFVCSIVPESPSKTVEYSPGGLLFKLGGCNLQNPTAISLLLLAYARYLNEADESVRCGNTIVSPLRLISLVKSQVDYILGHNPMNMSYMVGYGKKYPKFIHHRGSTLPSMDEHPGRLKCQDGSSYFKSSKPNRNVLLGAIVGGPALNDSYPDTRWLPYYSEPTTYVNAPFVGVLAYFVHHH
ncbi:hypothetical protein MKW92_049551 [Papaver armeniacum]|nr:hypothetical protein MKW92_049551 [Papaver armeniacum]